MRGHQSRRRFSRIQARAWGLRRREEERLEAEWGDECLTKSCAALRADLPILHGVSLGAKCTQVQQQGEADGAQVQKVLRVVATARVALSAFAEKLSEALESGDTASCTHLHGLVEPLLAR